MPRSQCENENVQFVQELAEVDGPFESPININYRDLTKLELPSLCWNRSEACPQKMKITNTGHTVIISGKWKCERPFLTGGPLMGKYVFSQIHFHWGQDECKGSEHQVCGEGFPLEMHVTHFKTDYLSQENALKEKDGMVIVAYLFKLQSEPNPALKKVISLLPCIQQPCTSQAFEPRPIMSLINPFTDDYFMYWGSVITSTCAHILLWMICREPFGISLEQVEEFRKILDSSQQPICRNSRDIQPLHKRNVFHVNACRDLDNPLLPIKQMLGCYCKGSEENSSLRSGKLEAPSANDCSCPVYFRNQEEIEETAPDNKSENFCSSVKGTEEKWDSTLSGSAYLKQYVYVQNAIISPPPLLAKKFESELIKKVHYPETKQIKSENNIKTSFVSQSCCFFPMEKINQIKPRPDRRKNREKKKSNSFKAFSNLLSSLEALKNHTFKKLKEIDAMNKEIQGMKSFCQNAEDKHWLWKIEKVMMTQKRFTVKKSQNCFGELKRLAKECNFDKLFESKQFPTNRKYQKIIQMKNNENRNPKPALPCPDVYQKKADNENNLTINRAAKVSIKSQKLIESFFEDIKENEELQKTVQRNLLLKKLGKIENKEAGDSKPISEGYITEKMFAMENLGDRFFTEVTTEVNTEEEKVEKVVITVEESLEHQESEKSEEKYKIIEVTNDKNDSVIPLRKATELSKLNDFSKHSDELENCFSITEDKYQRISYGSETETMSDDENLSKSYGGKKYRHKNTVKKPLDNYLKQLNELTKDKFQTELKTDAALASIWYSSSNFLTDSTETQRMFIAEFCKTKSKGDLWKRKSLIAKISSKKVSGKNQNKSKMKNFNFEGYYLKKKKRSKNTTITSSCDLSSSSTETAVIVNKSKWKQFMKAQLRWATKKSVKSRSSDSDMEYRIISPKRKRLKLDIKKKFASPAENKSPQKSKEALAFDKTLTKSTDTTRDEEIVEQLSNGNEKSALVPDDLIEKYREAVTQTATSKVEFKSFKDERSDSDSKMYNPTLVVTTENLEKSKMENSYQEDKIIKMAEEIPKTRMKKILIKNKSLTNLTNSQKFFSTKTPQRLFVENIDSRRKCLKESFDLKSIGTPRVVDGFKIWQDKQEELVKELQEELIHSSKTNIPEAQEKAEEAKDEADIFKAKVKETDEEFAPPQIQREKSKIPLVKRYDKRFLRRKRKEAENSKQKPIEENADQQREESKNSLTNEKNKPDDACIENEELQTPEFISSEKKYTENKSFSTESLNPLSRPLKRKNKKRPHICKRSSKHYIRKNSLGIRKPKQVESKSLQLTDVQDEELKQNFDGQEQQKDKNITGNEEIMIKSIKTNEETPNEKPAKKIGTIKKKGAKQDVTRVAKTPEPKTTLPKQDTKSAVAGTEVPKEKPSSPKPTHDFIKRNRLLAGKYKRGSSATEKATESKPTTPKQKQTEVKNASILSEDNKEAEAKQTKPDSPKSKNVTENVVKIKEKRTKIPRSVKKCGKTQESSPPPEAKGIDDGGQPEPENPNCQALEMAVQKMPLSNPRFLPAYMMTSDLPPPLEIVQNQQMQMNRYLLNMDTDSYMPLRDNLKKEKNVDFFYKKDLEYLLTLQRCLHGELSTSIENSMSYLKTLLSQEYNGPTTVLTDSSANEPLDYYDPLNYSDSCNSGLVLIEMSDFLESSTSNSDLSGYFKLKELDSLSQQLKDKIHMSKTPQDSGDPGIVNPIIKHNTQKDWHSDSNYDCQIFITLSANSNEGGTASQTTTEETSNGMQEVTSQSSSYMESGSLQSFTLKQQRKKRKENEISAEMKQKLLEILETEIKREMGVECSASMETGSEERVTYNLEDSEANERSQNTGSFDNMEVLAQISETMRQYLRSFNESELPPSTDEAD